MSALAREFPERDMADWVDSVYDAADRYLEDRRVEDEDVRVRQAADEALERV